MEIQVNGKFHRVPRRPITYEQVAAIVFFGASDFKPWRPKEEDLTITWRPYEKRRAPEGGELHPGDVVQPEEGLVFFVKRKNAGSGEKVAVGRQ